MIGIKQGDYYKVVISLSGKTLTYICKIIEEEDDFLTFIDKFGKTFCYRKIIIVSLEKIDEKDVPRIFNNCKEEK